MFKPYARYAEFGGRSGRSEFWLFMLFYMVAYAVLWGIGVATLGQVNAFAFPLVFALASFVPGLAVQIRRLHDSNRSGWNILWSLLPLVGSVILLVFFLLPGTSGANVYGPQDGTEGDADTRYIGGSGPGAGFNDNKLNELEKLGRLRDSNVLTEAEFAARKATILAA